MPYDTWDRKRDPNSDNYPYQRPGVDLAGNLIGVTVARPSESFTSRSVLVWRWHLNSLSYLEISNNLMDETADFQSENSPNTKLQSFPEATVR